jgi:hypothetical protein
MAFILAQILPAERPAMAVEASGGSIFAKMKPLPALCRPAGWIALWRTIGAMSVLDCGAALSFA